MKYEDLIKQLLQQGWQLSKHGGMHDIYRHPDFDYHIAIPRHKGEVPKGLAAKLLKQAGIK